MYFHYTHSTETLLEIQERAGQSARIHEGHADEIRQELPRLRGSAKRDAFFDLKNEQNRARRATRQFEHIQEELDWREDPSAIVALYQQAGYKPVYVVGHIEHETESAALREAHLAHQRNEIMRESGPDGSYVDDLVASEDMVQLRFVPRHH